jgi:hypothetical protein
MAATASIAKVSVGHEAVHLARIAYGRRDALLLEPSSLGCVFDAEWIGLARVAIHGVKLNGLPPSLVLIGGFVCVRHILQSIEIRCA